MTVAQFRTLAKLVRDMERPTQERDITQEDLLAMGYAKPMAMRIISLLNDNALLDCYLRNAKKAGCGVLSRVSQAYPHVLQRKLGLDAPGSLWYKGDSSILQLPAVALVGSRELGESNRDFAAEVGFQAAAQGYALISGNARGADRVAQEACLQGGGAVVSVVADELHTKPLQENVLYLSEQGFDLPFTSQRALSRNRVIHALPEKTFVAQSDFETGGTWDGSVKNLQMRLSDLFCYTDGSGGISALIDMGATAVTMDDLSNLDELHSDDLNFLSADE